MVEGKDMDATVYTLDYWREMLNYHDIHALFCQYSHPKQLTLQHKMVLPPPTPTNPNTSQH